MNAATQFIFAEPPTTSRGRPCATLATLSQPMPTTPTATTPVPTVTTSTSTMPTPATTYDYDLTTTTSQQQGTTTVAYYTYDATSNSTASRSVSPSASNTYTKTQDARLPAQPLRGVATTTQHTFTPEPTQYTALYYYGYRYYSSELGRWVSRDPIGERGGVNTVSFVGNRPIYIVDLLGRESSDCEDESSLGSTFGSFVHWRYEALYVFNRFGIRAHAWIDITGFPATIPRYVQVTGLGGTELATTDLLVRLVTHGDVVDASFLKKLLKCRAKLVKLKVHAEPTHGFDRGGTIQDTHTSEGSSRYRPGIAFSDSESSPDRSAYKYPWRTPNPYWGPGGGPLGAPGGAPFPRQTWKDYFFGDGTSIYIHRKVSWGNTPFMEPVAPGVTAGEEMYAGQEVKVSEETHTGVIQ